MAAPKKQWLTKTERKFLQRHLEDAIALHLGNLKPTGKVAAEFVSVVRGTRNATRAIEFLYLRFLGEHGLSQVDAPVRVRALLSCTECGAKRDVGRDPPPKNWSSLSESPHL